MNQYKKPKTRIKAITGKDGVTRYDEHVYKLNRRIQEFVYNLVCRKAELEYDSGAFWDEVQRIEDALLLKVREKYPNLTGDKCEENVRFEVKEVDYYKADQQ